MLFLVLGLVFSLFVVAHTVGAMTSSNYAIPLDSLNSGGTDDSQSGSYRLWDTVGEQATGDSASGSFAIRAGYRQMDSAYISISSPADVNLSSLSGIAGGESGGDATWTVITDSVAGYSLSVHASTSPAMQSSDGYFFSDYVPQGGDPDFAFTVPAAGSVFGFSPEGADIIPGYKDNGAVCGTGSTHTTNACWDGFTTSPKTIVERPYGNHPFGSTTTVKFRAGISASKIQEAGSYSATIIVTAVAL